MEIGKQVKVILLVHTPMQLVSGFSLLTQLGYDKNQVFVGLITRKNTEVVSFIHKVLNIDGILHDEIFNIDGFLSSKLFVVDYVKYLFKIVKFIKTVANNELFILPDRAHPFYRYIAILYQLFLKVDKKIVFCEEGASHYYRTFERSYVSNFDFIGKTIGRRFIELYKAERILHFSIKKFDEFDKDRNHDFILYPFRYMIELSDRFYQQHKLNVDEKVVFIIPTSMKSFEGIDLGIPLYRLWMEKLEKFNSFSRIIIKPHPIMDNDHLDEICIYFEEHGKKIEATSFDLKYVPIEYLFIKMPKNSLFLGYDSSSICIFGPKLFGANFNYSIVVNEIFDRDYKNVLRIGDVKSDYYLSSMMLMKKLENNGN